MPATIPRKSAGSTEVLRVRASKLVNGAPADPTAATVSAAVRDRTDTVVLAPLTASYVAQSWESDAATGRYWVSVLMGPSAVLNPAGPVAPAVERLYELWIRVVQGSEDVRRMVGFVALTP
jgi:hypothetical protein